MSTKPDRQEIEAADDAELWESKQLGASLEHARRVSPEKSKEIDDALGLQSNLHPASKGACGAAEGAGAM